MTPIRHSLPLALSLAGMLTACGGGTTQTIEQVEGRDDLTLVRIDTVIRDGETPPIKLEVPEGTASMLIEVKGGSGLYYMADFITPAGRNQVEAGHFVVRSAREVNGLVDWMYPNKPEIDLDPGEYTFVIRGKKSDGVTKLGSQSISINVYMPQEKTPDTCGIRLSFLTSTNSAEDQDQAESAVDQLVAIMDPIFRQIGVAIIDYSIQRDLDLQSGDIQLGDSSVLSVVDDVLKQALALEESHLADQGGARKDSIHILFVRKIGGDASGFNPAGYSMGLPGPFNADRPNAAVLVSSELYVGFDGFLNVAGMATSLAHEIGHYMGLYHTSEKGGADHDPIPDTPECTDSFSCDSEFHKNIMTSAFWLPGDPSIRHLFTEQQGKILRRHPLCIPMTVQLPEKPPEPLTCERTCEAPKTCARVGGSESCLPACDPDDAVPCESGSCEADMRGTFVCR